MNDYGKLFGELVFDDGLTEDVTIRSTTFTLKTLTEDGYNRADAAVPADEVSMAPVDIVLRKRSMSKVAHAITHINGVEVSDSVESRLELYNALKKLSKPAYNKLTTVFNNLVDQEAKLYDNVPEAAENFSNPESEK